MKKILIRLYRDWFIVSYIFLLLEIMFLGATMWLLLTPLVLLGVLVFTWFCKPCSTLRHLTWIMVKEYQRGQFKKLDSVILSYPMILWLELEAKQSFINDGFIGFQKSTLKKAESLKETYNEFFNHLKNNESWN